jgi:hypothetical protein
LHLEPLESRLPLTTTTAVVPDGDWLAPGTWDNGVPSSSVDAVVPAGSTVWLSGEAHEARSLVIRGSVEAVENEVNDKALSAEWILVDGGLFRVGNAADPYDANTFTLTLEGDDPTGAIPELGINSNDAFLMVRAGGSLELFGESETSWTQLDATALAGSTSVTFKEEVTWDIGDEIVIASTTFDMNQAETREIVAVSPDRKTVTLDAPLNHSHYGRLQDYDNGSGVIYTLDERAEVGLLSRNIKIQGDADAADDGIGGNLMFMKTAGPVHIDGVEFYHMGQKAQLGRYPIHWHLADDRTGDFVKNSSIHRTFNRAVTIHGSHNILVERTVAYDHVGHGYFIEDAVETGNQFYYNLGLVTREPTPGEELLPTDLGPKQFQISGPGTFWITNPDNIFIGNVAAGSQTGSGFWYALPTGPLGASRGDPQYSSVAPQRTDLGVFRDNRAHSNAVGLDVDGGPNVATQEAESAHYSPPNVADFTGLTAFANSKNGVYFRGTSNLHLTNARLADNVQGTMFAFDQTVRDSLIVGVSDNAFGGAKKHGFAVYDGPNTVDNVHFAGFNHDNAGLFTVIGAASRHVNHTFSRITFDDPTTPFTFPDTPENNTISRHWGFSLYDEDGSLTGAAGRSIVYDHPMMRSDGDIVQPGWEKAAVSLRRVGHLILDHGLEQPEQPVVTFLRTDGPGADASFTDYPTYEPYTQLGVLLNTDFVYTVNYDTPLVSSEIEINLEDAQPGDFLYLRVLNPWAWPGVTFAAVRDDEQAVRASDVSAYTTDDDGNVFLKVVIPPLKSEKVVTLTESTPPENRMVDTVADELDGDFGPGDYSLREAVERANTRPGIDTITFAPLLDGQTILLSLGDLEITDSVVIDGSSLEDGITIDAAGNDPTPNDDNGDGSRVFTINNRSSQSLFDVKLRALTLTGGDVSGSGGAIVSYESLSLVDSTVWGNFSTNSGGGVASILFSEGSATISNSTISGNRSGFDGGGVWFYSFAGGSTLIDGSTVAYNMADAGDSGGRSGGGVFLSDSPGHILKHTLVAHNLLGGGAPNDVAGTGEGTSAHNLIAVDGGVAGLQAGESGNTIGTPDEPIEPMLGPLADNGGATWTHALLPGSPAIDAGDPAFVPPPQFDQRGVARIVDGNADGSSIVDIGSFEFVQLGDLDGDGDADFDDIDDFVLGLNDPQAYEDAFGVSPALRGDMDHSGGLDFDDIDDFVLRLNQQAVHEAVFGGSAQANGDRDPDFGNFSGFVSFGRKRKA